MGHLRRIKKGYLPDVYKHKDYRETGKPVHLKFSVIHTDTKKIKRRAKKIQKNVEKFKRAKAKARGKNV